MKIRIQRSLSDYEDIIDHPHFVYQGRPQLPLEKRATQFAPFDALNGFGEMIQETVRPVSMRLELSEEQLKKLNDRLNALKKMLSFNPPVVVMHYVPDALKDGGAYQNYSGIIRRIDDVAQEIIFVGGFVIRFGNIYHIDSPMLPDYEPLS